MMNFIGILYDENEQWHMHGKYFLPIISVAIDKKLIKK